MKHDYIVLIVGKSGSGKSTICRKLRNEYNLKELKSYTTRRPRGSSDDTHTFITDKQFNELEGLCAYTEFDGHRYGATSAQVDESDLYVIDVKGVKYFLEKYEGKKIPMVVYIDADDYVREERMKMRGDDNKDIEKRMKVDEIEFKDAADYAIATYINNDDWMYDIGWISRDIYETFFA